MGALAYSGTGNFQSLLRANELHWPLSHIHITVLGRCQNSLSNKTSKLNHNLILKQLEQKCCNSYRWASEVNNFKAQFCNPVYGTHDHNSPGIFIPLTSAPLFKILIALSSFKWNTATAAACSNRPSFSNLKISENPKINFFNLIGWCGIALTFIKYF